MKINIWEYYKPELCLIVLSFTDDEILYRNGDLNTYSVSDGDTKLFLESSVYVGILILRNEEMDSSLTYLHLVALFV